MYDLTALQRRIKKEGVDKVIEDLASVSYNQDMVDFFTSQHILINGYPNLSLLYSLA